MFLPKQLDEMAKSLFRKSGYTIYRNSSPHSHLERRRKILRHYDIRLLLDVGANVGQYAQSMRRSGYQHDIVSFEPMATPFLELEKNCSMDSRWSCYHYGLGDTEESLSINISENSVSSSILPMQQKHLENAPKSKFVATETIAVKRLDDLEEWGRWESKGPTWLKIDVQGFEDRVLRGGQKRIPTISVIQLELSLSSLYDGQLTMLPMMALLADYGFDPIAFEPGFTDKRTGESLQVDGIFRNRNV
jgi:FkbM family methyltransferase